MEDEAGQIKLVNTMVDRHFYVDGWANYYKFLEHLVKEKIIEGLPGAAAVPTIMVLDDFSISARIGNISTLVKGATFTSDDFENIFTRYVAIDHLHKSL